MGVMSFSVGGMSPLAMKLEPWHSFELRMSLRLEGPFYKAMGVSAMVCDHLGRAGNGSSEALESVTSSVGSLKGTPSSVSLVNAVLVVSIN